MVARKVDVAQVLLWGHRIGAVYWDPADNVAAFEYEPDFQGSGIEIAPLMMPLSPRIYRFQSLSGTSFQGLPGLLADSLPDDFGNAIIDQWLVREGRDVADFSPVERLCYIGQRGTGALEFRPATRRAPRGSVALEIGSLVDLAQEVLSRRDGLKVQVGGDGKAFDDILRVGTSAGGARAKAVVAWNPDTDEMRSGQVKAPAGFQYWLLKFDGVANREHGLSDPQGYGKIEYAYYRMALAAGMQMMPCRLLQENGRSHFMTLRFDRHADGEKIHMQSLYAMSHLDNQLPGAHSYEQALQVIRQLDMPRKSLQEQFRRMVFNVVARNQDDHTKNIAFLMDKDGEWRLAPAFDVIYAFNPSGAWTSSHQMSINGTRDDFALDDLLRVAERFSVETPERIIGEVEHAVSGWSGFAESAGVAENAAAKIGAMHRFPGRSAETRR